MPVIFLLICSFLLVHRKVETFAQKVIQFCLKKVAIEKKNDFFEGIN